MEYPILLPPLNNLIRSHRQAPEKSEMIVSQPEFSQSSKIEGGGMSEQKLTCVSP